MHSLHLTRLGLAVAATLAVVSKLPGQGERVRGSAMPVSVAIHRTFMPEAGPSSFAVALGPDLGFCYDPGRGGINYVWRGEFVDLEPTWRAKINRPATVRGTIVYRETIRWPLRLNAAPREPTVSFMGYSILPDGVAFHYQLDGIAVREEIRLATDAGALIRRFQLSEPCTAWRYLVHPQPGVRLDSAEGLWNETRDALGGAGGREFELRLDFKGTEK